VLAASFGVFEVVRWFDDFVSNDRDSTLRSSKNSDAS
jgi:hypothetical protein